MKYDVLKVDDTAGGFMYIVHLAVGFGVRFFVYAIMIKGGPDPWLCALSGVNDSAIDNGVPVSDLELLIATGCSKDQLDCAVDKLEHVKRMKRAHDANY